MMTSSIGGIWLVSWAVVVLDLLAACLYDGSAFVLLQFLPIAVAICTILILMVAFFFWKLRAGRRLTMLVAFTLTVVAMIFFLGYFTEGDFILSDPSHDFQRFALDGPHWPDEDNQYAYHPADHPVPKSVRIIESRTFNGFDGEGAAILFAASKQDMASLISSNQVLPTDAARDWERLNRWSRWYLWKTSRVLGPSATLYIRKGPDGNTIDTASLAVSQDGTRGLFLYLNVN